MLNHVPSAAMCFSCSEQYYRIYIDMTHPFSKLCNVLKNDVTFVTL